MIGVLGCVRMRKVMAQMTISFFLFAVESSYVGRYGFGYPLLRICRSVYFYYVLVNLHKINQPFACLFTAHLALLSRELRVESVSLTS